MKVFYTTDFKGFFPVGSAAVVVAPDEEEARRMLDICLKDKGLEGLKPDETITELNTDKLGVYVLCDGNY